VPAYRGPTPRPQPVRGAGHALVLLMAVLVGAAAATLPTARAFAQFRETLFELVPAGSTALPFGRIGFCPAAGPCLKINIDHIDGRFVVADDSLQVGTSYRVTYLTLDGESEYALDGWVYEPERWQTTRDPEIGIAPELAYPTFTATDAGDLVFEVVRTPNPFWDQAYQDFVAAQNGGHAPPRWLVIAGATWPLGEQFTAAPEALFGVEEVQTGWSLGLAWRSVPEFMPLRSGTGGTLNRPRHRYVEIGLAYAGNRYVIGQALDPEATGDVTFHRLMLSVGLGTARGGTGFDLSGGVVLAGGGIFDGSSILEYDGRSYERLGFGGYLRLTWIFPVGPRALGPLARFDYTYFSADHGENDHWYGGMPALTAGLIIH